MPRYFLHIIRQGDVIKDLEGSELPDLDAFRGVDPDRSGLIAIDPQHIIMQQTGIIRETVAAQLVAVKYIDPLIRPDP